MHMIFYVSEEMVGPPNRWSNKHSDESNRNMYLTDNLGNRYDHLDVGGRMDMYLRVRPGKVIEGWFEFGPPVKGATSFTFHDNDYGFNTIPWIVLDKLTIMYQALTLNQFPSLVLEYRDKLWEPGITQDGGNALTHKQIPGCEIVEWPPSEPQGAYKNTMALGSVEYEIYGYIEPGSDWAVREYIAVGGFENPDPYVNPFFQVIIPLDTSLECILDAGEVLARLSPAGP
jgi:hypothetical protein